MNVRLASWVVVVALLATSGARAQTVDAEAARLFTEGVELLTGGRFADARDRLQAARLRQESPAVVYNLALAERGLGRYVEAAALLDRWLELAGDRVDAARRAEVEALRSESRAAIAYAVVDVAALNAEVTVDGQPWGRARLGVAIAINPGHHVFRATGAELRPDERALEVAQGQRVTVSLSPQPLFVMGTLRVEPSEPEATVYVDHRRSVVGVYLSEVRPGPHSVTVTAPGFPTYNTEVEVRAGQLRDLRVTLQHESSVFNRWWFWTGAGVVIAGAVAAGLAVSLSRPEAPDGGALNWVVQAQSSH